MIHDPIVLSSVLSGLDRRVFEAAKVAGPGLGGGQVAVPRLRTGVRAHATFASSSSVEAGVSPKKTIL